LRGINIAKIYERKMTVLGVAIEESVSLSYVLLTLLLFRVLTDLPVLDIGTGMSTAFVILLSFIITSIDHKNVITGCLKGLIVGILISLLLFVFCSGAQKITLVWIVVASTLTSTLLGLSNVSGTGSTGNF
jgi:hypothetical protein